MSAAVVTALKKIAVTLLTDKKGRKFVGSIIAISVTLAVYMKSNDISYNGINNIWNKNMVKRILENEKYIGKENYPRIINEDTFFRANAKKKVRASAAVEISEELQSPETQWTALSM